MRLRRFASLCAAALCCTAFCQVKAPAPAQGPRQAPPQDTDAIRRLEGTSLSSGQADWLPLKKLVYHSFPDQHAFSKLNGRFYVWRIRSEDLVFQANDPVSSDGQSSAGFYWFDLHGQPISSTAFRTGSRAFYQSCSLVSVPGVSGFVVEANLGGAISRPIQLDFGLDVYRPVLLRYAYSDGSLVQNPYCTPNFACGPKPIAHDRADVLDALSGYNPMVQLEALTWLSGVHSTLTADISSDTHEPVPDSIRYWTISTDSAVSQAASSLASSQVPWVAQAARFYVSMNKPQSVPNQQFSPSLKRLTWKDIRVGEGGEFDTGEATVKLGDKVVIQYGIALPNKTIAFTNFEGEENPALVEVGSNQIIEGLSQGLVGMKVGGVRVLQVPASLAYSEAGADVIPAGADLTIRVQVLHFATERSFSDATERVLRLHEVKVGRGAPVPSGANVKVSCKVFRLDGREVVIPNVTGVQDFNLATGTTIRKAILGMKRGGVRRLLVSFPSLFGQSSSWFHYGALVLQLRLLDIHEG